MSEITVSASDALPGDIIVEHPAPLADSTAIGDWRGYQILEAADLAQIDEVGIIFYLVPTKQHALREPAPLLLDSTAMLIVEREGDCEHDEGQGACIDCQRESYDEAVAEARAER